MTPHMGDFNDAIERPEPDRSEARPWRYEIQHGPDGETNYAWVYDEQNNLVCTAKTHHAKLIVGRSAILSAGLVPDEAAIRADEREKCAAIAASSDRQGEWPRGNVLRHSPTRLMQEAIAAAIRNGGQK